MQIILNNNPKIQLIDEYFCYQLKQFQTATNTSINLSKKEFWTEFNEWLSERKKISKEYLKVLEEIGIDCHSPLTAEIGKGPYDTVTSEKETTLITPYIYGLKKFKKNKIIKGNIKIEINNKNFIQYNSLITENPYTSSTITEWEHLFHNKYYTVSLGVYGKVYDKDRIEKIKQLKQLKQRLISNYTEETIQINDNYLDILTSYKTKNQPLKKKLTNK